MLNQDYRSVYARDGVYVFKRVGAAAAPAGKAATCRPPRRAPRRARQRHVLDRYSLALEARATHGRGGRTGGRDAAPAATGRSLLALALALVAAAPRLLARCTPPA